MTCALCRSGRIGKDAFKRARVRSIKWPKPQQPLKSVSVCTFIARSELRLDSNLQYIECFSSSKPVVPFATIKIVDEQSSCWCSHSNIISILRVYVGEYVLCGSL